MRMIQNFDSLRDDVLSYRLPPLQIATRLGLRTTSSSRGTAIIASSTCYADFARERFTTTFLNDVCSFKLDYGKIDWVIDYRTERGSL